MAVPVVATLGSALDTPSPDNAHDLDAPAGSADGDLLLAFINTLTGVTVASPPSGWTAVESSEDSGNTHAMLVYSKISGSSEPSSYTFGLSTPSYIWGQIARVTGADTAGTPINASDSDGPSYTGAPDAPAIITSVNDCLVIRSCSTGSFDRTHTKPAAHADVTTFSDNGGGFDNTVVSIEAPTAGSVAAAAWSLSSGTSRAIVTSIAIAPTAGGANPVPIIIHNDNIHRR